MHSTIPSPLRGIIVPMVTPLVDRDTLDIEGLEKLIDHILAGGVQGLFILGTTGEAPSLSYKIRRELIRRTTSQVNGRVPVLVGITDTSFVESVNIARYSADVGADALVVAAPYYFPAGQPELIEYIKHLTVELPLPLFIYNMPGFTKVVFEPETVRKIAEIPKVVGLKDSSANMIYFHQLQQLFQDKPDFTLLIGPEELLSETVLLGGHGGVCGGANMYPQLYVNLYNAALKKDLDAVAKYHSIVMKISTTIYSVGRYKSSYLKGLKCALSCMGICDDFIAEPFRRFKSPEREKNKQFLRELKLLTT